MRTLFCLLWIGTCIVSVQAQQLPPDSSIKQVSLQDVVIMAADSGVSEAFTFYRTGKLSTTEDILSRMEGVNLTKRGAFGMEPMLRAYSGGQINVTLNGMKMYGACTDKMDPITTYIEPGNLDKATVTQGASGSLMGSSIGGQLNMQLREATFQCHQQPIVNLFGQYASVNNGFNAGATVNVNSKTAALRFNTTWRNANNYSAGGGQEVLYSGYNKLNMFVNGVWKLPREHRLVVDYMYDRGRNIGYPALTMDVSKAVMQLIALTHRKEWLHVNLETKVYYNAIEHYMDDTHRPETVIHMDMPGWSYTTGAYSQVGFQKGIHQLQVRLDAHRSETRADMVMYPVNEKPMFMQTLPGNILSNVGGSVRYQIGLGQRYVSGFTYRMDGYEQYVMDETGILQWKAFGYNVAKPQHNLLHNASAFVSRKGKLGITQLTAAYGSRLPTANERLGFYLYVRSDGYDYLGKNDLLPETSTQLELKQTFIFNRVSMSVTGFHHLIHNYISAYVIEGYSQMTIGANGVKTYENTTAQLSGMEATLSAKLPAGFWYNANARYTYGVIGNGAAMQQVPPFKWIHALRYQFKSMQLQLEQNISAAQNRINSNFGEQATPAWSVFNVRWAYGWQTGASVLQLSVGVENILDKNYREHLNWGGIPQPGRNLMVGVNYYFN